MPIGHRVQSLLEVYKVLTHQNVRKTTKIEILGLWVIVLIFFNWKKSKSFLQAFSANF